VTPDFPVQPMPSLELLRMVCEPCFEQICGIAQQMSVEATVSGELLRTMCEPCFEQAITTLQQMTMISHELLRAMCEPFFDQMISALQQTLQQQALQQHFNDQCQSMQIMSQSTTGICFQPVFYPNTQLLSVDEASTEADDSGALASIFSGPSSEGEGVDAIVSKSEDSESTSDVERSIMVCRHWKSKGWCRLETKCKFLHPDHKCGISAPKGISASIIPAAEDAVPSMSAARRKQRKDKQRKDKQKQIHQGIEPPGGKRISLPMPEAAEVIAKP